MWSALLSPRWLHADWFVQPLGVPSVAWQLRHGYIYIGCVLPPHPHSTPHAPAALQERAYSMWASRAYVHQYEKYGLTAADFEQCFAQVEDVVERYASM